MNRMAMACLRAATLGILTAVLVACGGGGGNPGACISGSQACQTSSSPPPSPPAASQPLIASSSQWANICTWDGMQQFTRSYLDEVYLWYREIRNVDPAAYTNLGDYFYDLLTRELDANGQLKDRFSFIVTNTDADSLLTGANVGYGVRWETDAQGRTRVAFVDADSPAQAAGLARGGELVQVLTSGRADWYPNGMSEISFMYRAAPGAAASQVTLRTAAFQEDPLPLVRNLVSPAGRTAAYLLFNAHTNGAQDKLIAALTGIQQAGVNDLVLDMRYNQGGYLYTALSLSSMLAGPGSDGKVFEQLQFNDKRQDLTDSQAIRFSGEVQVGEIQYPTGTRLSRLGLPRVYVLATGSTCSASESVINSLRGIGVEVVLIGQPTCGKPYGFYRKDNCGVSYFPIEFQGVNALGFGDYAAGFKPTCPATDDFDRALGDPSERLLKTALHHMDSGNCGDPTAQSRILRMNPFNSAAASFARRPGKVILPAAP